MKPGSFTPSCSLSPARRRGHDTGRASPRSHRAPARSRLLQCVVTATLVVLSACAGSPTSNEMSANGDAARVVLLGISHAGGRELRQEVVVDSATQHFTVSRCDDAPIAAPCTMLRVTSEGTTPSETLRALFEATTTPAFRALNANYPAPAGIVAPDGGSSRLEVVRNGSRRVITWTSASYLPEALVRVHCVLLAAQLSKQLCD